jgi:hypothetical protein
MSNGRLLLSFAIIEKSFLGVTMPVYLTILNRLSNAQSTKQYILLKDG